MLKYYIYVSKAKVDMLLPQVPLTFKTKFAAEIGVHIGILSGKLSSNITNESTDTESHRVQVVSDYIESSRPLGNLESSKEWIKDRLEVKHVRAKENPEIFLLVGKKYGMYHLLGGSGHHVIGNVRASEVRVNYSYFPYIASRLPDIFSVEYAESLEQLKSLTPSSDRTVIAGIRNHEWADVVYAFYEASNATPFSVEFLARFLGYGNSLHGMRCTMCTPLYVRQL